MDFPDAPFTGGAVSGFTPNMSQLQVSEYDRRRGLGDMGAFNDPDLIVNKKPWLRPDGTHKANDEGDMSKTQEATETLKAMRVPDRGEPFAKDEQHKAVDDGDKDDEMEDENLGDKLFGKSKEASSRERTRAYNRRERHIGLRQFASKSTDELTSEKDDVDVLERLLDHEKKEAEDEKKGLATTMGPRGSGGMGGPGGGAAPPPPPAPTPSFPSGGGGGTGSGGMGGGGGVGPSIGIGKSMEMVKALNSRSMHIPAPLGPYDPFGIMQRAVQVPTSGSMPHEGAPMTLKAQESTHDFCGTHGLTFRKANGCGPCNLAKCSECEKCGSQMHKSFGGVMRCPRGH